MPLPSDKIPSASELKSTALDVVREARRLRRRAVLSRITLGLILSRITLGLIAPEGPRDSAPGDIDPEAPLGYTDSGEPKKVTNLHIVDPEGKKPTKVIKVKNW